MVDNRRSFLSKLAAVLGLSIVAKEASSKILDDETVVKAWQDPAFRASLSEEQWDALPSNPAGEIQSGQFKGGLEVASGNSCSGNSCSGNSCSGNNCSGNNCSGNNCSGNNCSGTIALVTTVPATAAPLIHVAKRIDAARFQADQ